MASSIDVTSPQGDMAGACTTAADGARGAWPNLAAHATVLPSPAIPLLGGLETRLLLDSGRAQGDCIVAMGAPGTEPKPVAVIDGATAAAYPIGPGGGDPREQGAEPLVIVTGDLADAIGGTGQVKILQPDGIYRRYSRWDRVDPADFPNRPDAVLQSLPQCGCGGYLGAPTVFGSFQEMVAYFYVVFTLARDAK